MKTEQLKDTTVTGDLTVSVKVNGQDIRFYAKALTQAEVTELYQTRHMVDKDSNY